MNLRPLAHVQSRGMANSTEWMWAGGLPIMLKLLCLGNGNTSALLTDRRDLKLPTARSATLSTVIFVVRLGVVPANGSDGNRA